jgi:hypothetical protein
LGGILNFDGINGITEFFWGGKWEILGQDSCGGQLTRLTGLGKRANLDRRNMKDIRLTVKTIF